MNQHDTASVNNKAIITAKEAARELKKRGLDMSEFAEEYGNQRQYRACDVLSYLGQ
jgi:hypothetical protein